ncbi:hypothetical protein BDV33DRAFT_87225 [Aspergillus novoparasiticus]|uniref:Uncharacterized protein n=1 Tax=Aspergillus novoparasiticus TaxID=986946 RepID=A0A5N6EUB0_9EURO|nr:hypothetical protein BDV33DRAFT_87225 [Aspergillus novoparasiticus]
MVSQSKSLSKTRVLFHMSQIVVIPHSRLSLALALWLGSGAPVILAVIILGTSFPVDIVVMSYDQRHDYTDHTGTTVRENHLIDWQRMYLVLELRDPTVTQVQYFVSRENVVQK